MKNIITLLLLVAGIAISQEVFAIENIVSLDDIEQPGTVDVVEPSKVLETEISFDWLDITQVQRDENISHFKNLLFDENQSRVYFTKDEFKKEFAKYRKDKDFKMHYMLTNNGVTEDEEAKYCAFYYKKNVLVMYAIQYKNNPTNAFYYTAFGKLYYTDVMSSEYPNFPYSSMQYDRNGNLKSAIYFVSKDIQYMFDSEKNFQGIWYKDKMFDKNGKQTLTRTAW